MSLKSELYDYFISSLTTEKCNKEPFERILLGFNNVWEKSKETTIHGSCTMIDENISYFIQKIKTHKQMTFQSILTLKSVTEMYRFIAKRTLSKIKEPEKRQEQLIKLGNELIVRFSNCKNNILKFSENIIKDEDTILVVGDSPLLEFVLEETLKKNINLKIKILEFGPEMNGRKMYTRLKKKGILTEFIPTSMLGIKIPNVDYVVTGAELISENGGLVNTCGTYTVSIIAKAHKIPFYVFSESFKFFRVYPNSISDIPFVEQGTLITIRSKRSYMHEVLRR